MWKISSKQVNLPEKETYILHGEKEITAVKDARLLCTFYTNAELTALDEVCKGREGEGDTDCRRGSIREKIEDGKENE